MRLTQEQLEKTVNGCIKGDRKCQQIIFETFFGKLLAVCMRYTKDRDTAQDILQDAFIKAFEKISDYNFTGSFEGWLRKITVNTAIDFVRKNKNLIFIEDGANQTDLTDNDEHAAETDETGFENINPDIVLEAIQNLSPAYRTVFNLYVFENYSHKEIAEMLNINQGTSKSNLAKAKQNLKKQLEKHTVINR
jgi:RNA polymerase sigma-70 factor (ECF subfamily)